MLDVVLLSTGTMSFQRSAFRDSGQSAASGNWAERCEKEEKSRIVSSEH
jgi:hypothetical protein